MYQFFESFGPETKSHIVKDRIREVRMKLFNTDENNKTEDGFIKIKPLCD